MILAPPIVARLPAVLVPKQSYQRILQVLGGIFRKHFYPDDAQRPGENAIPKIVGDILGG